MELLEALYTTRAMRRMRPDPIPEDVQKLILDAAIRAPTGGNAQGWRFLLIDAPDVKARLGDVYRQCIDQLWTTLYQPRVEAAKKDPETAESIEFSKMKRSADHLAENFDQTPLLLISFVQFDPTGSSIFPAVWNAMLAARGEGVGSTITSAFLFQNEKVFDVLGVPKDEGWHFGCCVAMGYPTGRWGVAPRTRADQVAFRNQWGGELGLEIPEPLWPK